MNTSQLAYKQLQESGAIEERNKLVLQFFEEIGGRGMAADIIRHAETSTVFDDGEARYCFQQNVYASVSELSGTGHLTLVGTTTNPKSGKLVKFYEINRGEILPVEKGEKGYKKRFEDLKKQYKNLSILSNEQEALLEEYRSGTVAQVDVQEAFAQGTNTGDWSKMNQLLGS